MNPLPKLDSHGVPHCTGARCPHRTVKDRCAITGENLERVCAPAAELVQLRAARSAFKEAHRG